MRFPLHTCACRPTIFGVPRVWSSNEIYRMLLKRTFRTLIIIMVTHYANLAR